MIYFYRITFECAIVYKKKSKKRKEMDNFLILKQLFLTAEAIIIGAGAGLSASGGYDFTNKEFFKYSFPDYHRLGYQKFWDILSKYWDVNDKNELEYYGFCASQVDVFLYDFNGPAKTVNNLPGDPHYHAPALQPYKDLYRLLYSDRLKIKNESSFYIFTTNVDHQFQLAGFPDSIILSPQGDLSFFQCSLPCTHDIYDGYEYVKKILNNIDRKTMSARPEDVPRCPKCGRRLIPNVRCDNRFIEEPHVLNYGGYNKFISKFVNTEKKVLLLELGVGFSTPSIIRFPFDRLVKNNKNFYLIRINNNHPEVPNDPSLKGRVFSMSDDISDVISRLVTEILDNNEI